MMEGSYKIVIDDDEMRWFFDYMLVEPTDGESYMVNLSARNKKLTADERIEFQLGRSEMMKTEVVRKHGGKWLYDFFAEKLYGYECNKLGMLTKNNKPYPDKALVAYAYLNPSSERLVATDTIAYAQQIKDELIDSYAKGSKGGVENQIYKLSKMGDHWKSCHAINPSRRCYIDFDIDCDLSQYLEYFNCSSYGSYLKLNCCPVLGNYDDWQKLYDQLKAVIEEKFPKGSYFIVQTSGGLHIVVKKEFLKFNPVEFIDLIESKWLKANSISYDEIVKNDNLMIPIPGTRQYNVKRQDFVKVNVLNKEDFDVQE